VKPISIALLLTALLSGCAGPNMIPIWWVEFTPSRADDAAVVSASAAAIGFTVRDIPQETLNAAGQGPEKRLAVWEWPEHKSTSMGLMQSETTGNYEILFEDDVTDGFELVGPACEKYLELVSVLKRKFAPQRMKFYKETCNPSGSN